MYEIFFQVYIEINLLIEKYSDRYYLFTVKIESYIKSRYSYIINQKKVWKDYDLFNKYFCCCLKRIPITDVFGSFLLFNCFVFYSMQYLMSTKILYPMIVISNKNYINKVKKNIRNKNILTCFSISIVLWHYYWISFTILCNVYYFFDKSNSKLLIIFFLHFCL